MTPSNAMPPKDLRVKPERSVSGGARRRRQALGGAQLMRNRADSWKAATTECVHVLFTR
jgi:hypothetical protein